MEPAKTFLTFRQLLSDWLATLYPNRKVVGRRSFTNC